MRAGAVRAGLTGLLAAAALTGQAPPSHAGTIIEPQAPAPGAVAVPAHPLQASREGVVTAHDGVALPDTVQVPSDAAPAGGWPVIVIPAPWGGADTDQVRGARYLAGRGYVVVTYTTRGFKNAGGQVDAMGPDDVRDASDVLDWTLAHTPSDPARVGIAGQSGGGGVALLAAAADPRFRVVVSLSGFTDLMAALRPNGTPSSFDTLGLDLAGTLNGRLSPDVERLFTDVLQNKDWAWATQFAAVRSPVDKLAELDANKPAVLLEQAWNDSSFPPGQIVDFYRRYAGPKRLELHPGDHSSPEELGVTWGDPANAAFSDAARWFDAYLGGADRTLLSQPPVLLEPRTENGPAPLEFGTDVTGSTSSTLSLGAVRGLLLPTGELAPKPAVVGPTTIHHGLNIVTALAGSVPLYPFQLEQFTGHPPALLMATIARDASAVWETGVQPTVLHLRGAPSLHLRVTPAASTGMLVAYLYDVDSSGIGTGDVIEHVPFTWTGQAAGQPFSLDVAMPPQAYDMPAGHRLALVVSMNDPLYTDVNTGRAALTIGAGSTLTVPLR